MKISIDTDKKMILIPAAVAKECFEYNVQNERLGREKISIQDFVNFDAIIKELPNYDFTEMRGKK